MSVSRLRAPSVPPVWMRLMDIAACVHQTGPVPTVTKVEVFSKRFKRKYDRIETHL